ncbi:Nucleoside-diphosphate-sugar epimerase [Limimonas halophila]|uniref:Nucleoside-diphosphate-sugar epimerase n=1 Tax=Limimonas halophila TaxID=1082479 RepID=A0A1G7S7T8_9PROT|nr:NAD-dependent epimerase/dehydratase family protein [Limimonas halophila]SDG19012.1 Nucleoside-diphosphate-sugar epimerase [Limimonas halophila]
MRVAVTGASGFVGARLLERLHEAGHALTVLRHRSAVPVPADADVVDGGLHDDDALACFVAGADAVIHCGGVVAAADDATFHRVNAEGTRRLGEAAAHAGVQRFLFVSSLAARQPELSAYAASKRAGEDALAAIDGLAWDALRPPAVYGPGDQQVLVFARLVKHGIGLLPAGDRARVSLIHVDDLVGAMEAWLTGPEPVGAVYELGDGRRGGYAWRTIIDAAARELTVHPWYIRPPAAALKALTYVVHGGARLLGRVAFLSPDKLRELRHDDWVCHDDRFRGRTGWRPRVPLGEGLRETLAWYRAKGWL